MANAPKYPVNVLMSKDPEKLPEDVDPSQKEVTYTQLHQARKKANKPKLIKFMIITFRFIWQKRISKRLSACYTSTINHYRYGNRKKLRRGLACSRFTRRNRKSCAGLWNNANQYVVQWPTSDILKAASSI